VGRADLKLIGTESPAGDTSEVLAAGGDALARRAWAEARELYERALTVEVSADALNRRRDCTRPTSSCSYGSCTGWSTQATPSSRSSTR
jgi:hypothetical protein